MSHGKGNTPGDNQRQNRDFKKAANELGLTPEQRDILHNQISGKGFSYNEIIEFAKSHFFV